MERPEHGDVEVGGERLMEGLRTYGANYTEFTRRFATWLGLHATDAAALAEILYAEDKGTPLSPARLSERVSLSSGATTILVNRLEAAGHVVRSREHADGRVVTLRSSPEIRPRAEEFFGPYSARMEREMARYAPEQLQQIENFVVHLRSAMDELLANEYRVTKGAGAKGEGKGGGKSERPEG